MLSHGTENTNSQRQEKARFLTMRFSRSGAALDMHDKWSTFLQAHRGYETVGSH
jgi:hypothetical protein